MRPGLLTWILLLSATTATPVSALRVVVATNDLGAITRAVLGEEDRISVVARPDRDPHTLEVRPSAVRLASKADFYVKAGLSLDLWSDEIVRGSRNRDLIVIDASTAIEALEVPGGPVDASMGDVHPEGNPHYWLDPLNVRPIAQFLAEQFAVVEVHRAEELHRNAEAFARRVEDRVPIWATRLHGGSFIEYHQTWRYFADRFELDIVASVEPFPGIPPSAKQLARLADRIHSQGVPVVVRDPYQSDAPLEFLARETPIRTVVLPSMCAAPTPESYLEHFETAVDGLSVAPKDSAP